MNYDFSSLSHSDFEDLARDLIGREIGVRFEAFPEGPDDGMDGRHTSAEGGIILQAKHYHRSGFPRLKSKGNITMAATVRAALYLRVSTGRQAENDLSIPDQRRQANSYCVSHGWEIAADYLAPPQPMIDGRSSSA